MSNVRWGYDAESKSEIEDEKRELLRLLASAKDDERKAIIRGSLSILESSDKTLSPSRSLLLNGHETAAEKVNAEATFSKSPPIRPVSARLRRPSMNNLDIIHEEKRMLEKSFDMKDAHIVELGKDDLYEINSSSIDPRFRIWNPFDVSANRWVTTGFLPQFLTLDFKASWIIVEIFIYCSGLNKVTVSIEGSINRIPLEKVNSTTFRYANSNSDKHNKAYGDKISFYFEESNDIFVAIEHIRIRAISAGS